MQHIENIDLRVIHQFVAALTPGDGIGNVALMIQDVLRHKGYFSEIYYEFGSASSGKPVSEYQCNVPHAVIYHHSMGSGIADEFCNSPARCRVVYYQGITPPLYLETVPSMAARAQLGRDQISDLASVSHAWITSSAFGASELAEMGICDATVIPLAVASTRIALLKAERTQDTVGQTRLLHVGRLMPHKGIADLIRASALIARQYSGDVQLRLVGDETFSAVYVRELKAYAQQLNIDVVVVGKIPEADLAREYANADIYLCASCHEGFGLPVAEAMLAGIPVIAFPHPAVAEVLKEQTLVLSRRDPALMAETALRILGDSGLKNSIVQNQLASAENYRPDAFEKRLIGTLSHILRED